MELPALVVFPENVRQIQGIIRLANEICELLGKFRGWGTAQARWRGTIVIFISRPESRTVSAGRDFVTLR